ncbi:MAG TPA: hypothetical protein ENK08_02155 [Chloroflexi bacterium]|nr:hypothetical protein [Chloroflexota bacterium]
MVNLRIDGGRCPPCLRCLAAIACLKGALVQERAGTPPVLDPDRCSGCGFCGPACPHDAVVEEEVPVHA